MSPKNKEPQSWAHSVKCIFQKDLTRFQLLYLRIFIFSCISLIIKYSFQEAFVENKQDGVSRKYIPPAR